MTVTTAEYWDIDGTPLNTLAFNIETLGGRSGVPVNIGDNTRVPYRAGRIWAPKQPDQRQLTLAMWVIGAEEDGTVPSGGARRALFNENLDKLRRLYHVTWRQVELTKRWEMNDGIYVATAQAEPVGAMEPSMMGRYGARLTLDYLLADPYFYAPAISSSSLAVSAATGVSNPGQAPVRKMTIRFTGSLTDPRLTNSTGETDIWVQYTGTISTGSDWVELDTDLFTAEDDGSNNVIGDISHAGARDWMLLYPGVNTLTLTASAGSGTCSIDFQPPYV